MYLICQIKDRPRPPMTYELTVVPNYPAGKIPAAGKIESPSRLPKCDSRLKPDKQETATKIVYVAYPVHSMPPPPPYDGRTKTSAS